MQIENKVVVVTGGASGIGKALCERFAIEGAGAVIVSRHGPSFVQQPPRSPDSFRGPGRRRCRRMGPRR